MITKHNGSLKYSTRKRIIIYCNGCEDAFDLVAKDVFANVANLTNVVINARKVGWKVKTGLGSYAYCPICKLNHKKTPNE